MMCIQQYAEVQDRKDTIVKKLRKRDLRKRSPLSLTVEPEDGRVCAENHVFTCSTPKATPLSPIMSLLALEHPSLDK